MIIGIVIVFYAYRIPFLFLFVYSFSKKICSFFHTNGKTEKQEYPGRFFIYWREKDKV